MSRASVIVDDDDEDDEFAGIESITASQWVRDPVVNRHSGPSSSSKHSSQDVTGESLAALLPSFSRSNNS